MKRHYVQTETGYRCASCRNEFKDKRYLGRHSTRKGCVPPTELGLTINLSVSPWHWVKAA